MAKKYQVAKVHQGIQGAFVWDLLGGLSGSSMDAGIARICSWQLQNGHQPVLILQLLQTIYCLSVPASTEFSEGESDL